MCAMTVNQSKGDIPVTLLIESLRMIFGSQVSSIRCLLSILPRCCPLRIKGVVKLVLVLCFAERLHLASEFLKVRLIIPLSKLGMFSSKIICVLNAGITLCTQGRQKIIAHTSEMVSP